MRSILKRSASILVALFLVQPVRGVNPERATARFDILIAGGSSSGVSAAIAAARLGVKVALLEDTPVLGGMLSNGICNIDGFSLEALSGIFEEFRLQVKEYYSEQARLDPFFRPKTRHYYADGRSYDANEVWEGGAWEPHVAQEIFRKMIRPYPNLTVFYRTWVTDVVTKEHRIQAVQTQNEAGERMTVQAQVFIDTTHEGDLAALAGAGFRIGREARSSLEPHAGQIFFFGATGEMLPGSTGRQDRGIPSYGLRLTLKQFPKGSKNHILASAPPGYASNEFAQAPDVLSPQLPNGKVEMNVNPIGNELQRVNWNWPEASWQERRQLFDLYRNRALSFLFYLQHVRNREDLGLPEDEYQDHEGIPYRLYVREARRIEGETLMTEADINPFLNDQGRLPNRPDSIAIGHYAIDAKMVQSKSDFASPDKGDGDLFLSTCVAPYQIPYGAILPRNVDNLLVPTALSATHIAFSAIRLDPVWSVLGQAAGIAGALAVRQQASLRTLPLSDIQKEELRQHVKLAFYWDLPVQSPYFVPVQRLTLADVLNGYPDQMFRAESTLTRAQAAVLVTKAFHIWPSVTDVHFSDVKPKHWAFQAIETLYDGRALRAFGFEPRWLSVRHYGAELAWFKRNEESLAFHPDATVTGSQFNELLAMIGHPAPGASGEKPINRGQATATIAAILDSQPHTKGELR